MIPGRAYLLLVLACGPAQPDPAVPEEACDSGDSCFRRAVALHADARYAQATPLFVQSCAFGSVRGCHAAGNMYRLGRGVTLDLCRAYRFFARACDPETQPESCDYAQNLDPDALGCLDDVSPASSTYEEDIEILHTLPPRR